MSIMDTAVEAVDKRVAANAEKEQLVGFDFSVLIPVVIQLVTSLIQGCLGDKSVEEVAKRMRSGGFWAKRAAREVINRAAKEEEQELTAKQRKLLMNSLLQEMKETSEADTIAMVEEIQQNTLSWDMF
ncbi:MAG: hypothetical protein KDA77_00230 [Planctomycetaceae bacterium]|nr:hypothetical protein [Planctomycetaceae bacterium]